jgi:hypothetical protein
MDLLRVGERAVDVEDEGLDAHADLRDGEGQWITGSSAPFA